MTAVYILSGAAVLLCLLLFAPVTFDFYCREQPRLTVRVWGIPLQLLPQRPQREKKRKTPKKQQAEPSWQEMLSSAFREDGLRATMYWLSRLAALLKTAAGRVLRAISVKQLRLELRVSGENAAAAAVHYGQVCATVYPALTLLYSGMRIRRHSVDIQPDFSEQGGAVLLAVRGHVAVWRLCGAAIGLLCGFLRMYIQEKQTERTDTDGRE